MFFTSDKSNIPVTIPYYLLLRSQIYPWQFHVLYFWQIFVRGKEHGMVSGMFVLSGVKNMELSRVYSTCQKYRTWNCHGYIRLVWGKEHGIVTPRSLLLTNRIYPRQFHILYPRQVEYTRDNYMLFTPDKLNRFVRGKERGMVSGMFVLSGVKNMELSRVYSTCPVTVPRSFPQTSRKYPWQFHVLYFWHVEYTRDNFMFFTSDRTWNCHGYIRFVRSKEHGIVTGLFDMSEVKNMELSRVYSTCLG
jgi:hypothetical protein